MDKTYKPQEFEDKIYRLWEKSKAFIPRRNKNKKSFSIIMPPPNANGRLHIGHAMFVTLEDIMTRYHRMKGDSVLWLPGADHAGIQTQVIFERKLRKEGKSRFDLGRKKFYKQCFKFTQDSKKIMYGQLKKLGASCDWTREKFTLDPKISRQVLETFVKLYKDGLAYRGERMINWCPRCMTALSDLEVERAQEKSSLWFIKYSLKQESRITGQKRFLVVATTRPETIFGDTAVAVNPDDFRYKNFVGQKVIVPIVEREVPVIADRKVDLEFGTGAVKVTPAHDPTDWEVGQRHKLESISVIGFDNKMSKGTSGRFAGMEIEEARKEIISVLKKSDYLINEKKYEHSVGYCERCGTKVEPLVSLQWFVKTKCLAQRAMTVVRKEKIEIIPKRFKKNYFHWMKNIRDWCVSRQIWWGHRLPIWYCGIKGLSELQKRMNPELIKVKSPATPAGRRQSKVKSMGCGHTMVSLTKPKSCPKCRRRTTIIQDPDTFDTWFSSGQWAFTTLGFKTKSSRAKNKEQKAKLTDFDYWYPTSVMETGYEILPIWVAKMIMLGLYITGKVPFKTVYLHGLIRDAFGQKMSKSKGNVIDPLDVIEKFGVDALRMALVVGASPGNDVSLGETKIRGYRNFTNKVWNIGRFILGHLPRRYDSIPSFSLKLAGLTDGDKEIAKKMRQLIKDTTVNLEEFKFSFAGEAIYQFIWHELADKYIESAKERLAKKDKAALSTLRYVLINSLKLLHPFMPFVTEVVWDKIPKKSKEPLIVSSWPK